MKELLYLNKYFVNTNTVFTGYYIQLSRKFSCFSRLNLLVVRLRQLKHFQKTKTLQHPLLGKLIYILLIIATTIIAGFLTFLMRQTLIVMSRHIEFDLKRSFQAV
jgi:ATP-binding cassette subfamily B protein